MANIQFYDPKAESDAKRRKLLAEQLTKKGNEPFKNEVVSGIVVKRSPFENLAQSASKYLGEYESQQADNQLADITANRQKMIGEALSQKNPQDTLSMLAQDPSTSDAALSIYGKQLSSSIDKPAPMRIADKLYELQTIASDPNRSAQERKAAETQYNLLGQSAKTYGFDRGLSYGFGLGGQQPQLPPVEQPMNPPAAQNIPNQDFINIPEKPGAPINEPQPNPAALSKLAQEYEAQLAQDTLPNNIQQPLPIDGAQPAIPLQPQAQVPSQNVFGVQAIPGYGQAAAGIAGQKKGAEVLAGEQAKIATAGQLAQTQALGKELGDTAATLSNVEAQMPRLESLVQELSNLGKDATYTAAGRFKDAARREAGLDVGRGAIAREEYISKVSNEVLPLLRATFGAQFTASEGERLLNTLGSPNVSPKEKDAVLRSFIQQKRESVNTMKRQLGQQPNNSRDSVVQRLQAAGVPQERIDAYLRAEGL